MAKKTTYHFRCGHTETVHYKETSENIRKIETEDCLACFKVNDPGGYAQMQREMVQWVKEKFSSSRR